MGKVKAESKKVSRVLALAIACMIMLSVVLVLTGTEVVEAEEVLRSSSEIRTPAEWETTEKVLYTNHSNSASIINYYSSLTSAIGSEYLHSFEKGVPNHALIYIRDYGPITIMNGMDREYNSLNPWDSPRQEGTWWIYPVQDIVDDFDENPIVDMAPLGVDGGDFMIDSGGLFFSNKDVSNSANLEKYGIYDTHHFTSISLHIDMYAKLVSENTIIISERIEQNIPRDGTPLTETEGDLLDDVASFFESSTPRNGKQYDIYRVPAWREYSNLISYTNSLIVNTLNDNKVVIPTYSCSWDADVKDLYETAMPDYTIKTVSSLNVLSRPDLTGHPSGGAVHCTTMQIPRKNVPPEIDNIEIEFPSINNVTFRVDILDYRWDGNDWVSCINFINKTLYYREHNTEDDFEERELNRVDQTDTYEI